MVYVCYNTMAKHSNSLYTPRRYATMSEMKGKPDLKKFSDIEWAAAVFVAIGAFAWGIAGLFEFDVTSVVFGTSPLFQRIVHILIGVSGIYWIAILVRRRS